MISMVTMITMMLMIPAIFFTISFILSKKTTWNQEKSTPFECGFDPVSSNRLPFSIQFFMISMIFLIFDVEITILIPLVIMLKYPLTKWMLLTSLTFLLILIIGLYFEYTEKSIEWKH